MSLQKTFTIIPESAPRIGGNSSTYQAPVRPMTSKQVQKVYRQATRVPRLSRAEQAKQDRAERERLRKEQEKEKSAARARAAKEKKREKEMVEREQRRRNRLPTVHVRPSQDTIARFARANGSARRRNSGGDEAKAAPTTEEGKGGPAPTLKQNQAAACGWNDSTTRDLDSVLDMVMEGEEIEAEMMRALDTIAANRHAAPCAATVSDTTTRVHATMRSISPPGSPQKRRKVVTCATYSACESMSRQGQRNKRQTGSAESLRTLEHTASPLPQEQQQMPPLSTQVIFSDLDSFFPTSSQQARELEDESLIERQRRPAATESKAEEQEAAPAPAVSAQSQQASPSPRACEKPQTDGASRRFFTSSGSREVVSLAKHQSLRTAARERWKRGDVDVDVDVNVEPCHRPTPRTSAPLHPANRAVQGIPSLSGSRGGAAKSTVLDPVEGKENMPAPSVAPLASQDSEYGGGWIDQLAAELVTAWDGV